MREAVIVSGVRTPLGKAPKGALSGTRADEMAALVLRTVVERTPGLAAGEVGDVIMGCAQPEGDQGLNVARIAAARAGFPAGVPGFTVNRFCASGLQAVALAAQRIMVGELDVAIGAGAESMSHVPMGGFKPQPNPYLMAHYPTVYMAMGHTAERVAARWQVSREDQDAFALRSHQKAGAAIQAGKFAAEIVPVPVERARLEGEQVVKEHLTFDTDEGVRYDTSLERLAGLKPAFGTSGTVTAGNSSQMSDGAAAVVLMSAAEAARRGLQPRAVFRSFATAGCDPDVMGIGPVYAVPKALRQAGLSLGDIDLIELNEAFASQSLAVIRELGLDLERVNVNGGAIALGHPLGCTGARQTVSIIHEAARRGARYGLITMCVGGGMGAAGVLEFVH